MSSAPAAVGACPEGSVGGAGAGAEEGGAPLPTVGPACPSPTRRFGRDLSVYGAGVGVSALSCQVGLLVMARVMGPRTYGLLALLLTLSSLLGSVLILGGEPAFCRLFFDERTSEGRRRLTSSWTVFLVLWSATACSVLSLTAAPASRWLTGSRVAVVPLLIVVATAPVVVANRMLGQALRNQFRSTTFAILAATRGLLTLAVSLVAVIVLRAGVTGALVGILVGEACSLPVRLVLVRPTVRARVDPRQFRDLLRFGLPMVPASVMLWVVTLSDRVLLAKMATLTALGLYGYANIMVNAGHVLSSAFGQAWSPHLYDRVDGDPKGASVEAARALTSILVVSGLFAVTVAAFAPDIVGLLAGGRYALAARAVPPLAIAFVAMATTRVTAVGLSVRKRTGAMATCSGLAAAVNVGLCLLLIPPYGIVGAAWASAIAYSALTGLYLARSQRLWRIPIEGRRVVTATVLIVGSVVASMGVDPRPGVGLWAKAVLVVAFIVGLFTTRCVDRQEVELLRRIVGAGRAAGAGPAAAGRARAASACRRRGLARWGVGRWAPADFSEPALVPIQLEAPPDARGRPSDVRSDMAARENAPLATEEVSAGEPGGSGLDGAGPACTAASPGPRPLPGQGPARPVVSVVVPMRNERRWIDACLAGFENQTWPRHHLEVIVVDGSSNDGSRQRVEWWARSRPWLKVVDNPQVRASAAFNRGIAEATGDLVVLFGAHAVADPEFIERSVATLERTGATGVGGRLDHIGCDRRSTAIGLAMTSRFGMASPFRFASDQRDVDTVGHPMYRRAAVVAVGGFDEDLERNSDYVLNWRLRQGGGRLVFDPTIRSTYRPRGDLRALARQFYDYGRAKADVARRHPGSVRPRHLAPPALVVAAGLAPLVWWTPLRRAVVVVTAAYAAGVIAAAALARRRDPGGEVAPATLVAAFPVMHLAWGGGFLAGMPRRRRGVG